MKKLIDLLAYPVEKTINILLKDKTTGKNILWATDTYRVNDSRRDIDEIKKENLMDFYAIKLQSRTSKTEDEQQARTRKKAEVFTPVWMCNKMNNYLDSEWFGKDNLFNIETEHNWNYKEEKITFSENDTWKKYVDSRRLEITCGEAPFLVSRYDVSTGELIYPLKKRIGLLDRKIRVVNENATEKNEWLKWVERAFQSCYGFEYQGDNLIIARINFIMTFYEYYKERWNEEPDVRTLRRFANIISWNLWQMDGFTDSTPHGVSEDDQEQMDMFDAMNIENDTYEEKTSLCKIQDWRADRFVLYQDLKKRGLGMSKEKKLFDYVIGNPPFHETNDSNGRQPPVYHRFMDAAFDVSDCVELITPARFLFNAGHTPKKWNTKMLQDEYFKVLYYEEISANVFSNTDIKGGIAIHIRNLRKNQGAINAFTSHQELNKIIKTVSCEVIGADMMDSIVSSRGNYRVENSFFLEYPFASERLGKGTGNMIASNFFKILPEVYTKGAAKEDEISFLCRIDNKRTYCNLKKSFVKENDYLYTFNVACPKSNGNGIFGEALTGTEILDMGTASTDTFISIGKFKTRIEAENLQKYMKTKFFRTMLGVKKVTQDNSKRVWNMIPLQDFTTESDIEWSESIAKIDRQLYKKYHLDADEIDFIENNVKEME